MTQYFLTLFLLINSSLALATHQKICPPKNQISPIALMFNYPIYDDKGKPPYGLKIQIDCSNKKKGMVKRNCTVQSLCAATNATDVPPQKSTASSIAIPSGLRMATLVSLVLYLAIQTLQ